jgi:hypothetical protein
MRLSWWAVLGLNSDLFRVSEVRNAAECGSMCSDLQFLCQMSPEASGNRRGLALGLALADYLRPGRLRQSRPDRRPSWRAVGRRAARRCTRGGDRGPARVPHRRLAPRMVRAAPRGECSASAAANSAGRVSQRAPRGCPGAEGVPTAGSAARSTPLRGRLAATRSKLLEGACRPARPGPAER